MRCKWDSVRGVWVECDVRGTDSLYLYGTCQFEFTCVDGGRDESKQSSHKTA